MSPKKKKKKKKKKNAQRYSFEVFINKQLP